MSDMSRKVIGRLAQVALVLVACWLAIHWVKSRFHSGARDMHVTALATIPDSLGPGDLRIYNEDSTVDLLLIGDKIAAGLSPKTVAQVRTEMDSDAKSDTGLGGSIASLVKKSVAGAIGTHAEFPISDLRDVRYDNGRLVFEWKNGGHHNMFDATRVNGKKASDTFRQEDAQRFIDAVHARQQQGAGR